VEPEGYVWDGQPYSSLSAIARTITGTAWSGPRFFALRPAERRNIQRDAASHRERQEGTGLPSSRDVRGVSERAFT
jgi:hypothetical protein